jgi:CspA family cold shock protein
MNGVITRLIADKGFGFIRGGDGVERVFHRSVVKAHRFEHLKEGQRVEFTDEAGPKGPRATDVRVTG